MTGLDIIGDVHGCATKLRGLLTRLGYQEHDGVFAHPDRQAVFVGDIIDRGPEQVDTVTLVRAMVDAGTARMTMGNHEFNAISFVTADPKRPEQSMRPDTEKNRKQHRAFLDQVDERQQEEMVAWFKTLPLWLDLDGIRVVHACWDPASMAVLGDTVVGAPMSERFVVAANTHGAPEFDAIETLLKGPEVDLRPHGPFVADGHTRHEARIRWWDRNATTLSSMAEIPPGARAPGGRPFGPLPDDASEAADRYRYTDSVPVVFGHYWRSGPLRVDGPTTVCVDYSAIKGGPLVAYRWDGESALVDAHLSAFA